MRSPVGTAHRVGGAVVWAVAWSLAGAAAVLLLVFHRGGFERQGFYLIDTTVAVVYGPVSALLLGRSRHPAGPLLAVYAIGGGLSAFGAQYGLASASLGGLPGSPFVLSLSDWAWVPGTLANATVLPWLLVVGANGVERRLSRTMTVTGLSVTAIATFTALTTENSVPNPLAIRGAGYERVASDVFVAAVLVALALAAVAVVWLYRCAVRGPAQERSGLAWLATGQLFMFFTYGAMLLPAELAGAFRLARVTDFLPLVAQTLLPVSLIVVVLRRRLWGAEALVSRVALWTMLATAIVAVYLAVAWGASEVLGMLTGTRDGVVPGLVAAGIVALVFHPLRAWLQVRVDGLVYGAVADPDRLLGDLGERLGDASDARARLQALATGVRTSLELGGVEIVGASPGGDLPPIIARSGEVTPESTELVLESGGERVGILRIAPKVDGWGAGPAAGRLPARTLSTARSLRGVIAVALQLAQAGVELEQARTRLLDVRQEERRLLRRELHDGLGPALAGVGLGLAAARNTLTRDPRDPRDVRAAADLLDRLQAELSVRTEEVRSLARTLLPPALDAGGLSLALDALAVRYSDGALRIDVTCAGADDLDARRQVAVYHVVSEAVLNVRRHADATRCVVAVRPESDGSVLVSVADDGRGLDPRAERTGVGLASMRERVSELGGTLTVVSDAGTRIQAVLP